MLLDDNQNKFDKALLNSEQEKSISFLLEQLKYHEEHGTDHIRVSEWTARIIKGQVYRRDRTLLFYRDVFNDANVPGSFKFQSVLCDYQNREAIKYHISTLRDVGKLREDQFLEFDIRVYPEIMKGLH